MTDRSYPQPLMDEVLRHSMAGAPSHLREDGTRVGVRVSRGSVGEVRDISDLGADPVEEPLRGRRPVGTWGRHDIDGSDRPRVALTDCSRRDVTAGQAGGDQTRTATP